MGDCLTVLYTNRTRTLLLDNICNLFISWPKLKNNFILIAFDVMSLQGTLFSKNRIPSTQLNIWLSTSYLMIWPSIKLECLTLPQMGVLNCVKVLYYMAMASKQELSQCVSAVFICKLGYLDVVYSTCYSNIFLLCALLCRTKKRDFLWVIFQEFVMHTNVTLVNSTRSA